MHITFVKKILENGDLCKKCAEVNTRLEQDNLLPLINQIAIAETANADSEGMRLASLHKVERAPFFLVEEDGEPVQVFDVYFKFRKFISDKTNAAVTAKEL